MFAIFRKTNHVSFHHFFYWMFVVLSFSLPEAFSFNKNIEMKIDLSVITHNFNLLCGLSLF